MRSFHFMVFSLSISTRRAFSLRLGRLSRLWELRSLWSFESYWMKITGLSSLSMKQDCYIWYVGGAYRLEDWWRLRDFSLFFLDRKRGASSLFCLRIWGKRSYFFGYFSFLGVFYSLIVSSLLQLWANFTVFSTKICFNSTSLVKSTWCYYLFWHFPWLIIFSSSFKISSGKSSSDPSQSLLSSPWSSSSFS